MFRLEKYKGISSRHTCPGCGARREFTRYVGDDGRYLADDVGKCNRDSKCGYHKTPRDYFEENPRDDFKPSRPKAQTRTMTTATVKPAARVQTQTIDFIDSKILRDSLGNYEQNSFVCFLLDLFRNEPEKVWQAVRRYFLGTEGEKVVFWQLDARRRVRTGKLMRYDTNTGKRIKETFTARNGEIVQIKVDWFHAHLKRRGLIPNDFNLRQCLFGEHLTFIDRRAPLAIVEAEKTAVIASIVLPDFIWLAAGGKQNLNAERLKPFGDRQIILYPDADGFAKWQEIAQEARSLGLSVKLSSLIERRATDAEKLGGFDLADYLIKERREINEFNSFAETYNAAVDKVLSDESARICFETILDEQKAILMLDGRLSESEAEDFIRQPENLRRAAMLAAN